MKKKIVLLGLCGMAIMVSMISNGQLIKPIGVTAVAAPLVIEPDNNVINLRRFHLVYSPVDRSFPKEYLQKQYWLYFKLPYNSYVQICGSKDPVLNTNTSNPYESGPGARKPLTLCEFFSPKLAVVNKTTNQTKIYSVPVSGDYGKRISTAGYQVKLEGPGEYDIRLQQTFPAEAEFRTIVNRPIAFSVGNMDLETDAFKAEVKREIDALVAQYRSFLGRTVVRTIYHFNANYDFLVASIGDSFMSGEGNPMICGKDLPNQNGEVFDRVTELVDDVKDRIDQSLTYFTNAISDGSLSDYLLGLFTTSTSIGFPVIEQAAGACNIPELTIAGLTAPNFDVAPSWIENGDRADNLKTSRSYINGGSLAAFQIENKYPGIVVTNISYATSGATAENLYQTSQHPYQQVSQIDQLANNLAGTNREIDALTIAIGANDIGFSSDITSLLTNDLHQLVVKLGNPFLSLVAAFISTDNPATVRRKILDRIHGLDEKFVLLDQKIRSKLKVKKVFLLEYPNAQFSINENGQFKIAGGCDVLDRGIMKISQSDAALMTEMGDSLNAKLSQLAGKYHWEFVSGTTAVFKGHGYCSSDRYFNKPGESCACQGNYQGMLHPNGKGFRKIGEKVLQKMEQAFDFNKLKKPQPVAVIPGKTF